MADDATKPKPQAEPTAPAAVRAKMEARPQPPQDARKLANEIIDRFPNIMARLAE